MKFIRHIIIALALTAVFILLSVFSTVEYAGDKKILDNKNGTSLINLALEKFNNFLLISDNIFVLGLSPTKIEKASKGGADLKEITDKTKETIENTDWTKITEKIKEELLSDWSRS